MIVVKKKTNFGEMLTVGELTDALSSDIFNEDNAPLSLHTENYSGYVVAVFKCASKECNNLHLLSNNHGTENHAVFTDKEISIRLMQISNKVYSFETKMTKKKILKVLKKISREKGLIGNTMADEFPLMITGVYKCSESCSAIHLDTSYENDSLGTDIFIPTPIPNKTLLN